MKKAITIGISLSLVFTLGFSPASASQCSARDTQKVRSMLVPITRISTFLGTNLIENAKVRVQIREILEHSESKRLKKRLRILYKAIKDGESQIGSTKIWGYHETGIWSHYKAALRLTQLGKC